MSRHKTPLRYPGGKQKLAPFIAEILKENDLELGEYAEPYAGGAGVAIELLLSGKVSKIHLNDSSRAVYAFWKSILSDTYEFCRRISAASMTVAEWRRQKEILSRQAEFNLLDVGFSLFFLNRCNRSGIATAGVIGGLKQNGPWKMDARFPRNELISRIEAIAAKKAFIRIKHWDAEKFLSDYLPTLPQRTLVYCDPPYFHKANRLYLNHYQPKDHGRIAALIQKQVKQPWIVSYDCVPEISAHYFKRRSLTYSLQYNAAKAYRGTEIMFISDQVELPQTSAVSFIKSALADCEK